MWLQEIFILGKQSLWVGLYCNNHPSQHKLNTSFSIWQCLSSQFSASFMSSIWMSGVGWTHLSLSLQHSNKKSLQLELSKEYSPHQFAALGHSWTCMVPATRAGFQGFTSWHSPFTTQVSLPHFAQKHLPNLLPGSSPPLGIPKGQCHHRGYDKPISFLCAEVSLYIIKHLKENNSMVVFFAKSISKVNNLLFLWQK